MLNQLLTKYLNMNLLKKGIYFLFAATVIVACSDDDDGPTGPIDGGGIQSPLAGTSWSIAAKMLLLE